MTASGGDAKLAKIKSDANYDGFGDGDDMEYEGVQSDEASDVGDYGW